MNNELKQFQEKFKVYENLIKEYTYWIWSLRPAQCTLGASILSLKRYATAFSHISQSEAAELAIITQDIESALQKTIGFERINYLMLMMIDPPVHFHVVPRSSSPKVFAGVEWSDATWPKPPDLGGPEIEAALSRQLIESIQRNIEG